jgi:hypothetical protein
MSLLFALDFQKTVNYEWVHLRSVAGRYRKLGVRPTASGRSRAKKPANLPVRRAVDRLQGPGSEVSL